MSYLEKKGASLIKGIEKTKDVNINSSRYWNNLCSEHGGGERDDSERLKPMAQLADGSALDIGCFFGHLCRYLYEKGCKPVVGIDFSLEAIKKAKRNYPFCMFVVAEATALPFRSSSFNIVTIAETLEHLTDFEEGLKEAERVGEKIIFSVPNESVYEEHVWTFSQKGIENLLKNRDGYVKILADKWLMGVYRNLDK